MSEVKNIKNEQWSVHYIYNKIENGEIIKDKYQRPKKWLVLKDTKDGKKPSIQEYINFLYVTQNSVHAITFGKKNGQIANIDGNNRLNAIIFYLKNPFEVYPQHFEILQRFVENTFTNLPNEVMKEVLTIFKSLSYNELMDFKYQTFFIKKNKKDLYEKYLKMYRDEWDTFFDGYEDNSHGFQSLFKIHNTTNFNDVKININLFEGYSDEELNDIYVQVNTYNSTFTDIELLAGRLCNVTNFKIHDNIIKNQIDNVLIDFYKERSKNEVLQCYQYTENSTMNAYDFIVGLQIYSNKECKMIENVDNIGLSLFFKIWKILYGNINNDSFTTNNINDFIDKIEKSTKILKEVHENFFPNNLCENLLKNNSKKETGLKRNNLYIIILAIIGMFNQNIAKNTIIKSIEKCILYHYFVKDIINDDDKEKYIKYDSISYKAGGAFIDNEAENIYKNPLNISNDIQQNIFDEVLNILLNQSIKNIDNKSLTIHNKIKEIKRRVRSYHEVVLLINYFRCKMPTKYLNYKFWIEHIIPFSSSWSEQIDIDRLGNIIPIINELNKRRANTHIHSYSTIEKELNIEFIKYLDDIIPNSDIYNNIVDHSHKKKPKIINNIYFNTLCVQNENKLKKELLTYLFP